MWTVLKTLRRPPLTVRGLQHFWVPSLRSVFFPIVIKLPPTVLPSHLVKFKIFVGGISSDGSDGSCMTLVVHVIPPLGIRL